MKSGRKGGGGGGGGGGVGRLFPLCALRVKSRFQSLCGLGCLLLLGLVLLLHHLPAGRSPVLGRGLCPPIVPTPHPPVAPQTRSLMVAVTASAPRLAVPTSSPDLQTCARKKHVMFLKVHKSGSTTVANILQRFVLHENLNVLLPNRLPGTFGFNVLSRSASLPPHTLIPAPPGQQHHVVCNHMVYNRTALEQLLPNDTVYVAVAREPESRFVSAMAYYGMLNLLSRATGGRSNATPYMFSEYLAQPQLFGEPPEVHNALAFNLGVPLSQYHNMSYLAELVQRLDREFALLLLMEKLDEGLLMLRRLLCWDMRDIIYIKRNEGTKTPDYAMTESDRKLFQEWQEADYFLYRYFHRRFHRQLAAQGPDFFEELIYFRQTQRRVRDFCIHNLGDFQEPLFIKASPYNAEFTVTLEDCSLLLSDELTLVEELMHRAWSKYHEAGGTLKAYENHVSEEDPNNYYGGPTSSEVNNPPENIEVSQPRVWRGGAAGSQSKTIEEVPLPQLVPGENAAVAQGKVGGGNLVLPQSNVGRRESNNVSGHWSEVKFRELPPLPEFNGAKAGFGLQGKEYQLRDIVNSGLAAKTEHGVLRGTIWKIKPERGSAPDANDGMASFPVHAQQSEPVDEERGSPAVDAQGSTAHQSSSKRERDVGDADLQLHRVLSRSSLGLDGAHWGSVGAGDPKHDEIQDSAVSSARKSQDLPAKPPAPTMGSVPVPERVKIGGTHAREGSKVAGDKKKLRRSQ